MKIKNYRNLIYSISFYVCVTRGRKQTKKNENIGQFVIGGNSGLMKKNATKNYKT